MIYTLIGEEPLIANKMRSNTSGFDSRLFRCTMLSPRDHVKGTSFKSQIYRDLTVSFRLRDHMTTIQVTSRKTSKITRTEEYLDIVCICSLSATRLISIGVSLPCQSNAGSLNQLPLHSCQSERVLKLRTGCPSLQFRIQRLQTPYLDAVCTGDHTSA